MSIQCPNCNSHNVRNKDVAKQVGQRVGSAAGTATGIAGAMQGATTGASVGLAAGPVGSVIGSLLGAIIGGVVGGTVGHEVGGRIGEQIDHTYLDNCECIDFNLQRDDDPGYCRDHHLFFSSNLPEALGLELTPRSWTVGS